MSVRTAKPVAALLLLLGLVALSALRPATADASTACRSGFRVLHNDRIGALSLPAGTYRLRVQGLSCARAASLFSLFLDDYGGRLPGGWTAGSRGRGRGLFRRGASSFSVAFGRPGGGTRPVTDLTCPTAFPVPAPTQAGLLPLQAARYQLTRLSAVSPSCARAARLLTGFLGRTTQTLPGGWISLPDDGAFVSGSTTYGFRLQPLLR